MEESEISSRLLLFAGVKYTFKNNKTNRKTRLTHRGAYAKIIVCAKDERLDEEKNI